MNSKHTGNVPGYCGYDQALEAVYTACEANGIARWLVNGPALLLHASTYSPDSGYQVTPHQVITDSRDYVGAPLVQQAELGRTLIGRDDPTSGRISEVVAIDDLGGEHISVTFSNGSRLDAQPRPGTASVTWSFTRFDQEGPDTGDAGTFSWVGRDRLAMKLVQYARIERRRTATFDPVRWLNERAAHGLPAGPPVENVPYTPPEVPGAVYMAPTPPNPHRAQFAAAVFDTVADKATQWAAADGTELTLTCGNSPTPDPAVAAVLPRLTLTPTGNPTTADGWTITYRSPTL